MSTWRWVAVEGSRLHYELIGSGEPVVLIHGLSGSSRWWSRNVAALAEHFAVYVIDLMGFGRNRGRQRFVLADSAGHLASWLDAVGLERAHLIGHSMGGFIAAAFAAEYPARVGRVVLVDAAVPLPPKNLLHYAANLGREIRGAGPRFLPLVATDALRAGPWTILNAADQLLTASIEQDLTRIQAPVLLVWGERDTLVPQSVADRLAELIPRTERAIIAGAGHNSMWDRPDEFNAAVIAFLSQTERRRTIDR